MLLDQVFEPFIQEAPVCVMARGVLQRLLVGRQSSIDGSDGVPFLDCQANA